MPWLLDIVHSGRVPPIAIRDAMKVYKMSSIRTPQQIQQKPWGYTLIEILIVLAIIVLLIAVLFPILSRMHDQQRMAQCLSNLHQIMIATHAYATDHDGFGPDEESQYTWDALLQPYVKDMRIYGCPADRDDMRETYGSSYEIRDSFAVDLDHPQRSFLDKRLLDASPSSLIFYFDAAPNWHNPDTINAVAIDGAARAYTLEEFDENLELEVQ